MKNIKRNNPKSLLLNIVTIILFSIPFNSFANDQEIVAKFNGKNITSLEVMNYVKDNMPQLVNPKSSKFSDQASQLKSILIENYIFNIILQKEVNEKKIKETTEFKNALEDVAKKIFINNYIKDKITKEKIQQKYKEYQAEYNGKMQYNISHIIVKDQQTSKNIKQKLNNGEKFNNLAKEFSIDQTSKDQAGRLPAMTRDQLPKEYLEIVDALKANENSSPIKTPIGWSIVRLDSKESIVVESFEEAQEKMFRIVENEELKQMLVELKKKYNVEIHTKEEKNIQEAK